LEVIITGGSSTSIFCICFSHKYRTQGERLVKAKYSSQYNDELNNLRAKRLISEEDYNKKKAEIVKDL
jgi:hypothetical protein